MAMCSNARGGGGGSIKTTLYDPCFRSIHNVQGFPADLQLLSILYVHTADRLRIVASLLSHAASVYAFMYITDHVLHMYSVLFQAALKAASHHSNTLVCFCVHCHSISNIGELPDISIHIAMFATLHLPTSAYPLLQLGLKHTAYTKSTECEMIVVKPRESNPKSC